MLLNLAYKKIQTLIVYHRLHKLHIVTQDDVCIYIFTAFNIQTILNYVFIKSC